MKSAILMMLVVLVIAVGLVIHRGLWAEAAKASWTQAGQFVPLLLIAMVVVGCTEVLLSREWVEKWMSDASGFRGIGIAWIAGILTPGGSLIGLPLAAGLHRAGVGAAVLVTYLASISLLSVIRLPLEVGFVGGKLATIRFVTCLFLPPIAGLLTRLAAPLLR